MTEPNGLCYMRARYYDPQIGRFISQDPLGFAGGDINLYLYGHNNPLRFIDPLGLCSRALGQEIGDRVQWQVSVSGLEDMPGIAKEAVQILAAAGVGVAVYTAYPAVIVTARTPQGQKVFNDVIDGLTPGPPNSKLGVYTSVTKDIIKGVFK